MRNTRNRRSAQFLSSHVLSCLFHGVQTFPKFDNLYQVEFKIAYLDDRGKTMLALEHGLQCFLVLMLLLLLLHIVPGIFVHRSEAIPKQLLGGLVDFYNTRNTWIYQLKNRDSLILARIQTHF